MLRSCLRFERAILVITVVTIQPSDRLLLHLCVVKHEQWLLWKLYRLILKARSYFEGANCSGARGATSACFACPSSLGHVEALLRPLGETERAHFVRFFFCLEKIVGSINPFFNINLEPQATKLRIRSTTCAASEVIRDSSLTYSFLPRNVQVFSWSQSYPGTPYLMTVFVRAGPELHH